MKFSPKCRTKKLGIMKTILGGFCSFLNWEGADIQPQIRPRKISADHIFDLTLCILVTPKMWTLANISWSKLFAKTKKNLYRKK